MNPDALNLAIAQSIEPFDERKFNMEGPPDPTCLFRWSPLRMWRNGVRSNRDDDWHPRDFINDPSLSFLLLKRLAEEGDEPMLDYEAGWMVCGKANDWTSTPGYRNFSCARHPDPGPAIAEYYARAKGIYVDDKA